MYQQSSSLTAESMNAANKSVRDCTAVDPINAMLLLLMLEARRFSKNKEKAWSWTEVLAPHGKKLSDKAFSKVNPRDYTIRAPWSESLSLNIEVNNCPFVSFVPLQIMSVCLVCPPTNYHENSI
jgi:hypothetical protein